MVRLLPWGISRKMGTENAAKGGQRFSTRHDSAPQWTHGNTRDTSGCHWVAGSWHLQRGLGVPLATLQCTGWLPKGNHVATGPTAAGRGAQSSLEMWLWGPPSHVAAFLPQATNHGIGGQVVSLLWNILLPPTSHSELTSSAQLPVPAAAVP